MESHPGDTLGTRFLTFWGAIGAFFGFAIFAILLQRCTSDGSSDPRDVVRAANLVEVRSAGVAELEKLGWGADDSEAVRKAVALAKGRKQSQTKVVVPGSATAAEQAAAAATETDPAASGEGEAGGVGEEGSNTDPKAPVEGGVDTPEVKAAPTTGDSKAATDLPTSGSDSSDKKEPEKS